MTIRININSLLSFRFGTVASYYCRGGGKFALVGPSKLKCLADGSWDAANPPSCIGRGDKASHFVTRLRGAWQ